jgi:hypothetical protein
MVNNKINHDEHLGTSRALRVRLKKKPSTATAMTAIIANTTIIATAHCGSALEAASSAAMSC